MKNKAVTLFRAIVEQLKRDFHQIEIIRICPNTEGKTHYQVALFCSAADDECEDCPEVRVFHRDPFTGLLVAWRKAYYLEEAGDLIGELTVEKPRIRRRVRR